MSSKERLLYVAISYLLILYIIHIFTPDSEEYIKEYNAKIESLEQKVDSLHHINGELTFKIDTLKVQILDLDQKIYTQNKKITILKNKTNEKINSVDLFIDDELKLFFTNRYQQYYDTLKKTNSETRN